MPLLTVPLITDAREVVRSFFVSMQLKELYRQLDERIDGSWWFVGKRQGVSVVANATCNSNYLWLFFFVDTEKTDNEVSHLFFEMQRIFPEKKFQPEEILTEKMRFAEALIRGKRSNE